MNRDEQRCQPLLLNPLPVGITEVGECEIGAVEKTESIVIILEVKTVAVTGWLLINETEGAAVGALAKAIKQSFRESKTKSVIGIFFQLHAVQLTGAVTNFERQLLINDEISVIDEIARTHTIDAQQLIPGLESQFLSD